jgi:hypothetical protein
MAAFTWGDAGAQMTPEAIAAQRKIAQAMIARGSDYSPIQSWTQGAARVAEGLMGGLDARQADVAERRNAAAEKELLASLITGGGMPATAAAAPVAAPVAATAVAAPAGADQAVYAPPPAPAPAPTTFRPGITAPTGDAASAIASIESGGKYDLLGPVTKTGDRAYGKYQVMGANVPEWTKTHLGQAMTPEQFLASPEAQDAVFKGQFGQYSQKYGPEGAAKAWFAGERGMTNPNAKDQLGTSVQSYADRFSKAYGGLPYQVAGPATAAPAVAAVSPTAGVAPAAAPAAAPVAAPGVQAAAPGVQAVAQATSPSVNPKLLTAMASPYVSDGTKKILGIMLTNQLSQDAVTQVDLGNKVGIMDKRGNIIRTIDKGEPNKGPTFGETGEVDPQTGQPVRGWIDPRDKSVTPYRPQPAASAQPSTIPPVPPGVDPKVWRETFSKATAAGAAPASFDDTAKLRHEVTQLPSYKNMAQAAPIYQAMHEAAGRDTKAADLNLVYGLGKIMDPGSVVREGEIQMANNAQGWQEKLNGYLAQINSKGGLTPEGRQALMAEAHGRIQAYKGEFDRDAGRYKGITERNRMNTADVIPDFGTFEPWMAPKANGPVEIDGYKIKAK